jgi:hypothetical protein
MSLKQAAKPKRKDDPRNCTECGQDQCKCKHRCGGCDLLNLCEDCGYPEIKRLESQVRELKRQKKYLQELLNSNKITYIDTPPYVGNEPNRSATTEEPKKAAEMDGFEAKPAVVPVLISPVQVIAPRYFYYVTYTATLRGIASPTIGAVELYLTEPKIERTAQLVELHERIKSKLEETVTRDILSVVVTGWTFLRKQ